MKKTLAIAILSLAAVAAQAADVSAFALYDYDKAEAASWRGTHVAKLGVKLGTAFGSFDVAAAGRQVDARARTNAFGGEVGYSNGVNLLGLNLTGRAAFGQLETTKYYSLAAEASKQVTPTFGLFGGYRHTNGLNRTTFAAANRYTVGADFTFGAVTARLGYARTAVAGENTNGLVTAVSYKF